MHQRKHLDQCTEKQKWYESRDFASVAIHLCVTIMLLISGNRHFAPINATDWAVSSSRTIIKFFAVGPNQFFTFAIFRLRGIYIAHNQPVATITIAETITLTTVTNQELDVWLWQDATSYSSKALWPLVTREHRLPNKLVASELSNITKIIMKHCE